jgi:hypothetical protein
MARKPRGPTTEVGAPAPNYTATGGVMPWSAYMDDREYAPDVTWPVSNETYRRMQADAQVKGLLLATTLPIRRFLWEIDPNGARPEVVEHIADSLNLPIRGQDRPSVRRRQRFDWGRHLAHVLRALAYGHYYFEQVYDWADPRAGGDGLLHLRKLGTRPPRTISNILTAPDGGLKAIEQSVGIGSNADRVLGANIGSGARLDVSRLLAYIWDSEDDGDWIGRSMLRACFRNWLIKDRLIRVDATKHERNAMGIPWFEVDPNASNDQIKELAATAERMRAGEQAGGAGPGKLMVKGVDGTLPDTIGSVRYHDEQMSKNFLLMLFNLGGDAASGSRALGDTFADWYPESQGAIADWARDTTQEHQIEDEVALNWGDDEQPPALVYTRLETSSLALADLATAVREGLIAVDPELRSYIVQRFGLPKGAAEAPLPAPAPPDAPPAAQPAASAPEGSTRRPVRSELATRLAETIKGPVRWADAARAVGADPKNGTARRARDELVAAGTLVKRHDGAGATVLAPPAGIALPDRDLRRQPYDFEVTAAVDFEAMEATYLRERESLVEAVKAAQGAQIEALAAAVESAAGDAATLANLRVEPVSVDIIRPHLATAAREGEASAKAEHDAQMGVAASARPTAAAADQGRVDDTLDERAEAVALTLAAGLAVAASKRATAVSTLPAASAAADVRDYLLGLSDAELNRQLGGATMQSYNTGRREYMRANDPREVYASELLDGNTCQSCLGVDGTEYGSIEASESDYPIGGYIYCDGGLLCRGTIVAVY